MWVDNVASLTTNNTNFRHSTLWMCLPYDSSITLVLTLVLNENRDRTSLTPTIWHSANVAIGPCLNQNTTCRDCASDSTKHAKCLKYLPIADYRESPTTPAIDFTPIVSFSIVCCGKDTNSPISCRRANFPASVCWVTCPLSGHGAPPVGCRAMHCSPSGSLSRALCQHQIQMQALDFLRFVQLRNETSWRFISQRKINVLRKLF